MPASDTEMQDAPASSQDESAQATAGAQDQPDESDPNDTEAGYDIQDGYQHSQRIRVVFTIQSPGLVDIQGAKCAKLWM